ncbi:hypothetical protein SDC9_193903 [bioreactor metagenome]|uniref:Uncharacterized protein n=1 Tax=bioreactor metagenome TaxID=1076179 RepID=A0A645I4U1_9ZZZZ
MWQLTTLYDQREVGLGFVGALGLGIVGGKNFGGSKDTLGGCLACIGASAAADMTIVKIAYVYPDALPGKNSANLSVGGDVHALWGVGVDLKIEDNSTSFSFKTGPGIGASFKGIAVEKEL